MIQIRPELFCFIIIARPGECVQGPLSAIVAIYKKLACTNIELKIIIGETPSLQRNRGASISKANYLIFFDNDSAPDIDYFDYIQDAFRFCPELVAVGGISELTHDEQPFSKTVKYVFASAFGIGPIRPRYNSMGKLRFSNEKELILCNLLVEKKAFLELGGFHPQLFPNEENELLNRLQKKGKILHHPLLVVKRPARKNLKHFISQMKNYGRGRTEHFFINKNYKDLIYFIPLVFMLYLCSLPLLWLTLPWFSNIILVPLMIYISVLVFVVLNNWYSIEDHRISLRLGPTIFYCHCFYSFGLALGLVFGKKVKVKGHEELMEFNSVNDIEKYLETRNLSINN